MRDESFDRINESEMPEWAHIAKRNKELAEAAAHHQEDAQRVVDNAIITVENERTALAKVYADALAHSIAENELGNAIAAVRKCLAILKKAAGNLAQQPLPMK